DLMLLFKRENFMFVQGSVKAEFVSFCTKARQATLSDLIQLVQDSLDASFLWFGYCFHDLISLRCIFPRRLFLPFRLPLHALDAGLGTLRHSRPWFAQPLAHRSWWSGGNS